MVRFGTLLQRKVCFSLMPELFSMTVYSLHRFHSLLSWRFGTTQIIELCLLCRTKIWDYRWLWVPLRNKSSWSFLAHPISFAMPSEVCKFLNHVNCPLEILCPTLDYRPSQCCRVRLDSVNQSIGITLQQSSHRNRDQFLDVTTQGRKHFLQSFYHCWHCFAGNSHGNVCMETFYLHQIYMSWDIASYVLMQHDCIRTDLRFQAGRPKDIQNCDDFFHYAHLL